MRTAPPPPRLGGAVALVLHRPHDTVAALTRQLAAIGLEARQRWPELEPGDAAADFLFFDADLCHDAQLPWPRGEAPMPMIALIGSEAPGRIDWALAAGASAQMLKPVGAAGAYAALLTAHRAFAARRALAAEIGALEARMGHRETVVQAALRLAAQGGTEREAYARLRQIAMAWQVTIEEAATRINGAEGGDDRQRG